MDAGELWCVVVVGENRTSAWFADFDRAVEEARQFARSLGAARVRLRHQRGDEVRELGIDEARFSRAAETGVVWERIGGRQYSEEHEPNLPGVAQWADGPDLLRSRIAGGWLVVCAGAATFVPDAVGAWDGTSSAWLDDLERRE
jgi:hypothetical protein